MYSVVRTFEGRGHTAATISEAARARVRVLDKVPGFVTLLAIEAETDTLITIEIFESADDMRAALRNGGGVDVSHGEGGLTCVATTVGEIVFQRGL
jgi:heme-degrading monooxygenase HmoA